MKVRYRGLKKYAAQIVTLFALGDLWMARLKLLAMAQVRIQGDKASKTRQLRPAQGANGTERTELLKAAAASAQILP